MKERSARRLVVDVLTRLGINQKQLARKLGVSKATVSNWITGRGVPRSDQRDMLMKLLGKSAGSRTLAEWVAHECEARGWTAVDLAAMAGLSSPTVHSIECGRNTNPHERTLRALENAFKTQMPARLKRR